MEKRSGNRFGKGGREGGEVKEEEYERRKRKGRDQGGGVV